MALNPPPAQLQLHAPIVGPWFVAIGSGSLPANLPAPAADLAIPLTVNSVSWLPPASGYVSFFIATSERPAGLASLRAADGSPAFATGSFVALFRLLSWVERRLDALTTVNIGSIANPATAGSPTRPIVRYLAMELAGAATPTSMADIENLLWDDFSFPSGVNDDAGKATNLGLTWDGTSLGNAERPMTDLLQPGALFPGTGTYQELLRFTSSTAVRIWSFDHRGRPIDAGAVAAWWNFLASQVHNDMWAPNAVANRTAAVDPALVFHLVNANEGPLDQASQNRLTLTDNTGSGVVQTAHNNRGVTVAFNAAPSPDDLPQPLGATLPDGRYQAQTQAWPNGALNNLNRDFARIAVMSVEQQLVGQSRIESATSTAADRRARDQVRPSTAVLAGRAMRADASGAIPAMLPTSDVVLGAVAAPVAGGVSTTVVASVVDRDAGPLAATLQNGGVPAAAPTLTIAALDGGGTSDGGDPGTAIGQRALVTATVGAAFQGAWIRIWPLGFDHRTGEHVRLDGGGAPVDAVGVARMVIDLPDGTVSTADPPRLGMDVLVVTLSNSVLFPDQRVDRPFPVGGTPVNLAAAVPPLLVCSTGVQFAAVLPVGAVASGSEVVALGGSDPALIDRSTIPIANFAAATVANQLGAADTVQLTQPAFQTQSASPHASGDPAGTAGAPGTVSESGAVVAEETRQPFTNGGFWAAGFPYPGMQRLEVVVSHPPQAAGFAGAAVVGSTPPLGSLHELPRHDQGHPECPAAPEVHGSGVLVTGSASVDVAEYARDRTAGSTTALITAAFNAPIVEPAAPNNDSLWMATLRTEAAGVASELAYEVLNMITGNPYPFDGTWDDIANFLTPVLGALPDPTGTAAGLVSARRALDRRILAASYGACEAATAIVAAIGRAEDFVYIETPAFDSLTFGRDGDEISLWQALIDRMDAVPSLRVAVCAPLRLLPGAPEPLQRARDQAMADALSAMTSGDRAERFVAFAPAAGPARSLRLASTNVIVDDLVAFVGTTHLWRRGLSFDSSLAISVIDERLARGRSLAVLAYRTALMASQLNVAVADLPLDPADAILTISRLVERGGLGRLAPDHLRPPDPAVSQADLETWNPDGSFPSGTPLAWLGALFLADDDTVNPPGA